VLKGILCNQLKHISYLVGCPLFSKGATRCLELLRGISSPLQPPIWPKVRQSVHIVLPLAFHRHRPSFDVVPDTRSSRVFGRSWCSAGSTSRS